MLKFMNIAVMLVILCGELHLSCGEKLKCEFKDHSYGIVGTVYSCNVTSLDNSFDNMIDGYTGTHEANKVDKDVKAIFIIHKNTKYIPANLGSFSNLLALAISSSQLIEIKAENFLGMQNLEFLSFYNNKLTSVPSNAFFSLQKLIYVNLNVNQIKYIGSGVFDNLINLNEVYLAGNICLNIQYVGATAITQMKHNIKANCQNPNDIIQYEIEHKISNESTKNRKEFELLNQKMDKTKEENQGQLKALNDMIKTLLKATEEHQKDRDEIVQLTTAKEEQKTEKESNIKVINEITQERDELKKKLSEAKETIDQKLPKMEQLIEDFYMEVMDLKIERHNERQNSIALRSKLMEANEQLAECKNE